MWTATPELLQAGQSKVEFRRDLPVDRPFIAARVRMRGPFLKTNFDEKLTTTFSRYRGSLSIFPHISASRAFRAPNRYPCGAYYSLEWNDATIDRRDTRSVLLVRPVDRMAGLYGRERYFVYSVQTSTGFPGLLCISRDALLCGFLRELRYVRGMPLAVAEKDLDALGHAHLCDCLLPFGRALLRCVILV
jgi:hypothetical protein